MERVIAKVKDFLKRAKKPKTEAADPSSKEKTGGYKFVVDSHVKNAKPLSSFLSSSDLKRAWGSYGGSIEAMSPTPEGTVGVFTEKNMLAQAVHDAFYDHRPLVLSPDVIWITITQGLARHVEANAEQLRPQFVSFEGKKNIEIFRPDFRKGSPDNDWQSIFPAFAAQIEANTKGEIAKAAKCDFSTTTPTEAVVSQIVLMDAMQHYFTYGLTGGCGFPSIRLRGTPADWSKLRAQADLLRAYDLDWWLEALLPALDHFVSAAHGQPDLHFWRSLCNAFGGSAPIGEVPMTGWVQVFFPYLQNGELRKYGVQPTPKKLSLTRNPHLGAYMDSYRNQIDVEHFKGGAEMVENGCGRGITLRQIPPGISSAPFIFTDLSTHTAHDMALVGGITCLIQHSSGGSTGGGGGGGDRGADGNEEGAIEPVVGWAVLDMGSSRPVEGEKN